MSCDIEMMIGVAYVVSMIAAAISLAAMILAEKKECPKKEGKEMQEDIK